jgi:hypothetical protein
MPVPKAPVNQYGLSPSYKDHVWSARKISTMEPVASESEEAQLPPNN